MIKSVLLSESGDIEQSKTVKSCKKQKRAVNNPPVFAIYHYLFLMGNRKNEINFPIFANWGVRFDEIVFPLW